MPSYIYLTHVSAVSKKVFTLLPFVAQTWLNWNGIAAATKPYWRNKSKKGRGRPENIAKRNKMAMIAIYKQVVISYMVRGMLIAFENLIICEKRLPLVSETIGHLFSLREWPGLDGVLEPPCSLELIQRNQPF